MTLLGSKAAWAGLGEAVALCSAVPAVSSVTQWAARHGLDSAAMWLQAARVLQPFPALQAAEAAAYRGDPSARLAATWPPDQLAYYGFLLDQHGHRAHAIAVLSGLVEECGGDRIGLQPAKPGVHCQLGQLYLANLYLVSDAKLTVKFFLDMFTPVHGPTTGEAEAVLRMPGQSTLDLLDVVAELALHGLLGRTDRALCDALWERTEQQVRVVVDEVCPAAGLVGIPVDGSRRCGPALLHSAASAIARLVACTERDLIALSPAAFNLGHALMKTEDAIAAGRAYLTAVAVSAAHDYVRSGQNHGLPYDDTWRSVVDMERATDAFLPWVLRAWRQAGQWQELEGLLLATRRALHRPEGHTLLLGPFDATLIHDISMWDTLGVARKLAARHSTTLRRQALVEAWRVATTASRDCAAAADREADPTAQWLVRLHCRRHLLRRHGSGTRGQAALRVGAMSFDYRDHPVGFFARPLFRHWPRRSATGGGLVAISIGPDDGSPCRSHIEQLARPFVDLMDLHDEAAVRAAREQDLHVLFDLQGMTDQNRPNMLAQRLAPVQAMYLGMASTTGSAFHDYNVVDRFVVQPWEASAFSEKLAISKRSYLVPNYPPEEQAVADRVLASSGEVPCDQDSPAWPHCGVVFAAFHSTRKLVPATMQIWCNALRRVPGSVLWLRGQSVSPASREHLRAEAAARGLHPSRLVFAEHVDDKFGYLRQVAKAHLFLDTPTGFGAHSTAADMLRCGLPVVTKSPNASPAWSGRVAYSLLRNLDPQLGNLLTGHSARDMEDLPVRLGRCSGLLRSVRRLLRMAVAGAVTRSTAPFDEADSAARLHRGAELMWETHIVLTDAAVRGHEPVAAEETHPFTRHLVIGEPASS